MSHVSRDCLGVMFERQGDDGALCDPDLFFHRFRPFITTWTAIFEGQYDPEKAEQLRKLQEQLRLIDTLSVANPELPDLTSHRDHLASAITGLQKRKRLCGPSGAMSAILPLCDAFLGIEMSSQELGTMLRVFEEYMPEPHRGLLALVRGSSVRPFVLEMLESDDPQADSLVEHFNAVVRNVLDFRWRHLSYIEQYVLRPSGMYTARGTGGTPASSYLSQHIEDTEAALIIVSEKTDRKSRDERRSGDTSPESRASSLSRAFDLWSVSESHGLLPAQTLLPLEQLPPSWAGVRTLAYKLPAACVPPASFRRLVCEATERFPKDLGDLRGEMMHEVARYAASSFDPWSPV